MSAPTPPLLPVIFLMGPTAAGKTALAVELAARFPVELINADSALIYCGLNIGAARPSDAVLARAPHRLLGIRDVTTPYSVAEFREDALNAIDDSHAAGKVPLLVGGTMLYYKALLEGLADLPSADQTLRAGYEAKAAELGWPALHQRLAEVDAPTAARLAPNDSQRIQRALEVFDLTGVPLSEHHRRHKASVQLLDSGGQGTSAFPYNVQAFAVAPQARATLHQRIAERFDVMLEQGLINEVKHFYQQSGVHRDLPAMRAVGYRQVWDYLSGECDYDTMKAKALVATRRLAKRQLTWLRSWPDVNWLCSDNADALIASGVERMGAIMDIAPTD